MSPLFVLPYPAIDPVLIQIGPVAIRWYALAYIGGLFLGWYYVIRLIRRCAAAAPTQGQTRKRWPSREEIDDLLVWCTLGVILGGRLGYVVFYNLDYYLDHPIRIFAVWQGGMSFHGGMLGVGLALYLFARQRRILFLRVADILACAAPIGLFLGRLANFINGELYGRVSDVPWAMIFPGAGAAPRHPSQIYEAILEGAVLFVVMWVLARRIHLFAKPGLLTGVFLVGYALARGFSEFFREPDAHIGFVWGMLTMGHILSLPLLVLGLFLWLNAQAQGKLTNHESTS